MKKNKKNNHLFDNSCRDIGLATPPKGRDWVWSSGREAASPRGRANSPDSIGIAPEGRPTPRHIERTINTLTAILGYACAALLLCLAFPLQAQYHANLNQSNATEAAWVDSVFNTLTLEQRLGQLVMIRAYPNQDADHIASVEQLIQKYHVGGVCFFKGTPDQQVKLVNRYQQLAPVPLMVAIDGEWGLNMRMTEVIGFPRQLTLGAIRDNQLIYDMGVEVARQMKRVGVHVNFAPVVDVNNNPDNPVIGTRSFGEDRVNVAIKGVQYMKGMQDNGVVACAKHFPGHGDTDVDSHHDLPIIPHARRRLDSIEMYPFRVLVEYGVGSIMTAHLEVPALETKPHYPTSLSENTIVNILQEELGFYGLTFTDGLGMKGVTKYFGDGLVEAEALRAGNDILLLPESIAAAFTQIKAWMADGRLTEGEINQKVKRVLRAKYRMGLTQFTPLPEGDVLAELNTPKAAALKEKLIERALTLVRNKGNVLPIGELTNKKITSLAIGASAQPMFQKRLLDYAPVELLRTDASISNSEAEGLLERLSGRDWVIVSLHGMGKSADNNFGIQPGTVAFLHRLQQQTNVALVVFGNPYSLRSFDEVGCVLMAYNDDALTQDKAAQAVFGAIGMDGRLPVSASVGSPFNAGVTTYRNFRMGYSVPERVGMDGDTLRTRIARIANEAIEAGATPGCVVLVARQGKIIYHEAFGHHTYSKKQPVAPDDIYDLASVTKVAATTTAIMDLVQTRRLLLDKTLGDYLPELKGTNKENLVIRDVLAHRSPLQPWIPFYTHTLEKDGMRVADLYSSKASSGYNLQVTDKLFLQTAYLDSIWMAIDTSELRDNSNYRYSDLGFYYMARIVKAISGKELDDYVRDRFYKPLGLFNIDFHPRERFELDRIVPSEVDNYWRQQPVHGYVHDMGAAMLGGVSGHAGLFGNAHDLAILGQLWLQRGIYGNHVYLKPEVVREFSSRYPTETRRGLGFDMKQLDYNKSQNVSPLAGDKVFGHLGFTGTCIWADPDEELLFIFLSNRTYPSMHNAKLGNMQIRPRLQSAAYRSITHSLMKVPIVLPLETKELPVEVVSEGGK